MSDESIAKKLRRAKEMACTILMKAGYRIEKTHNATFCLTAMRESEWRIVAIGIREALKSKLFDEQRKKLEFLPVPDPRLIQKEIWIRETGEHNFKIYIWKNNAWLDEEMKPAVILQ